ncbi:MAG: DUF92 domain-containing protein [Nanoarchaeota archaeon]|nr:DUF92 domain-containing protein [Nanoarchaeota archaeon]MBU4300186.1 DUF92 domain-containing protein [Nanoarchaeota archaeon]MBU4452060.1 DUF92 domain-containing protein [Nanoarchaeota archaeon]MCG2724441.1 DUF92 domain-containing protein [archaeon]
MDYFSFIWILAFVVLSLFLLSIRAFDVTATLVAFLFGIIILKLQGIQWFIVLFTFLIVSLYATFYGRMKAHRKPHECRGVDNVISNGLVAFMTTVFSFPYVFLGSVSAALSDTLSSEIGILSKEDPRMITDISKAVPPGTNGAISIIGTLAAVGGAAITATLAVIFAPSFLPAEQTILFYPKLKLFLSVLVGGFMGSIADSFLGVLENENLMTNGSVNFMATLVGGLITTVMMYFL